MKNNFIAKNMNKVNRSSIHIDKKKEGLTSQEDIEQGLEEIKTSKISFSTDQATHLGDSMMDHYVNLFKNK